MELFTATGTLIFFYNQRCSICAPRVTRHISIRYSSSCNHTSQHGCINILRHGCNMSGHVMLVTVYFSKEWSVHLLTGKCTKHTDFRWVTRGMWVFGSPHSDTATIYCTADVECRFVTELHLFQEMIIGKFLGLHCRKRAAIFRSPTRESLQSWFPETATIHSHNAMGFVINMCAVPTMQFALYTHNASGTGIYIIYPIEIYTHNANCIINPLAIYTHIAIVFVINLCCFACSVSCFVRHLRYQVRPRY